jgi:hypothetical protein
LGNRILNLADPAHVNTLSEIVLRESDDIRATTTSIPWTKFENDFSKLVKRFDAENPIPPEAEQNREEIDRHTIGSLRDSVKNLCNLRILYQGYEHKCRKCFHRSWISIADLRPEIACEVCRDIQQAPVDEPWRFRLNGFLHEALQRHGIGPLFWVLSRFQRCSSSSFWFEGPLNIFPDQASADENRPETDIDLTIVNNGIVIMCEVKQSERGFTNPKRLADTMLKLRPDVAMIAVMEANGLALQKKFLEFSDYLEGTGIKPELLTLDAKNDISGDPYF